MDRRKTDRRDRNAGDPLMIDIQALWNVLWKRRMLLAFVFLMLAIPCVIHILMKPEVYKATATLVLENQSLNLTDFQDALPQERFDVPDIDTQLKILQSPALAYRTLTSLSNEETDESARHQRLRDFLKNLDISSQGKSRVVSVSYKSQNPERAAETANAHARAYVEFQTERRHERVVSINEWINGQITQLKEDGRKKALATQEFRKEAGIIPGKNSQDLISQQIIDLTQQLVPIETEKLRLQAQAAAVAGKGTGDSIGEIANSDIVRQLKLRESQARQELEALKATHSTQHPAYIAAQNRYRQAGADVGREASNIRTSITVALASVTQQEEMLRSRLEELNRIADELRGNQVALESMESEELANKTLLDSFLARSEELRAQLDLARPDARVESLAQTPVMPDGTSKSILIVLVLILCAVAAAGIILLYELRDRGVEDGEDVRKTLNLRLLGRLPYTKNPLSGAASKKASTYTEELKRIYLSIAARKAPQTVLLTSSRAGEGKSTTVLALARYMTSIGKKTILIDADTVHSTLSRKTVQNAQSGLAEVLSGNADVATAIVTDDTGLTMIASGNLLSGSIDFLAAPRLADMLDDLKTRFDYVLISCAPVLEKTDAEILSGVADQVILIVEREKVSKKILKEVAVTLRQYSKDIPGVILNKAS